MSALFLRVVNGSIAAAWLVLAVLLLRVLLRRAPKWTRGLLWAVVGLRLVWPFTWESAWSLLPSAETIPLDIQRETAPAIASGVEAIDRVVNPVLSQSAAPDLGASANPLQIWIPAVAVLWMIGVAALLLYAAVGYGHLRRRVSTAIRVQDSVFRSAYVAEPFVLGLFKPRIYLPLRLEGPELAYVLAHEQAHIARRDHWWKPLGFLLLTIHWFNPLLWLAYALLCRDIELACDERVIKGLDRESRADYTEALVSCSIRRRHIAACPLAFGEVGVKARVKAVLHYKKPAFWVLVLAVAACLAAAVCFLTNPKPDRTFPMTGTNVADLEPDRIVARISEIEGLEDGSQVWTGADPFDQVLTAAFDWEEDAAIRFFYQQHQTTYGGQLRMDRAEGVFFVTERTEWTEPSLRYLLYDYLKALQCLPQEAIRALAPADGYNLVVEEGGAPEDYDRVISYAADGPCALDGWYIHLRLEPLHANGGAYSGTGDEVVHLFYGERAEAAPPDGESALPPLMNLETLRALVQSRGEDLTWADWEAYAREEVGFGLLIWRIPLAEGSYDVMIGGSLDTAPLYVRLVSTADRDRYIDLRTDDLETFLAEDSGTEGSYTVRIQRTDVQVFDGPGYDYGYVDTITEAGVYTIVEERRDGEDHLWGRLKSGLGWIDLEAARESADSQPPVTVSLADEGALGTGAYQEFVAEASAYTTYLLFTPTEILRDVRLSLVQYDEDGEAVLEELYSCGTLTPDKPLLAGVVFYGDMTAYVLTGTDESGETGRYAVSRSGRNGAPILTPAQP